METSSTTQLSFVFVIGCINELESLLYNVEAFRL